MAHEKSMTFEIDGKYYNVPSVVKGKQLTKRKAVDLAIKNDTLGKAFNTQKEAIAAAEKRSIAQSKIEELEEALEGREF